MCSQQFLPGAENRIVLMFEARELCERTRHDLFRQGRELCFRNHVSPAGFEEFYLVENNLIEVGSDGLSNPAFALGRPAAEPLGEFHALQNSLFDGVQRKELAVTADELKTDLGTRLAHDFAQPEL